MKNGLNIEWFLAKATSESHTIKFNPLNPSKNGGTNKFCGLRLIKLYEYYPVWMLTAF